MTTEPDIAGTVFDGEAQAVAKTYAEALVNVSLKAGEADAVVAEMEELVRDVLKLHPRIAALFADPSVASEDKDRILSDAFEGRALPTVLRFLKVLNNHGRLELIAPVASQARKLLDRLQNRIPVTVRSAVPLDEWQQASLLEKLKKTTGGTPLLRLQVDPELIGGLIVQVGDNLFDASVKTQLERLRRTLVEAKVREIQDRRDTIIV